MRFTRSLTVGAMRTLACVAVLGFTSQSTLDARVSFNPVFFLSWYSTDNVSLANANEPKFSDNSASVGVTLPVRRESRHGWLEFFYTTAYTQYQQATAFDDINHYLGFRLANDPNPMSSVTVDACYVRTQEQDRGVGSCTRLFTSERARQDLFGADFGYRRLVARRWSVNFDLEAGAANFEPIEGVDLGDTGLPVEDKLGYLARIGVGRRFSNRLSFGMSYSYSVVDQEVSPTVQTHVLRLDIEHQATKRLEYRLNVGAYNRSSDEVDASQGDFRDQGIEFRFELRYGESKGFQLGPVRLELNAGIQPTAGGAIQGTSTNVFASAALTPSRQSKWDWRLGSQYFVRVPTRKEEVNLQTFTGEFQVERSVVSLLGIRFRGFYRDQMSDDPMQAVSYYRVELGMTWYPMGRRRVSSG